MSAIHESSRLVPLPEFDLFKVPPTQLSVERDVETEHRPISVVSHFSPLCFQIVTSDDEYILLSESKLYMELKLTLKKIKISAGNVETPQTVVVADWAKVLPTNYLLHSLFKQIEITYNGKELTYAPTTYAYRAIFEGLLGNAKSAKDGYLQGAGWSNSAAFTAFSSKPDEVHLDLIGKLHTDLTFQDKALLGRSVIDIKFIPHDQSFYLNITDTYTGTGVTKALDVRYDVAVEFVNPTLYIHRAKTTPMLVQKHKTALSLTPAKYPITRVEVKPIILVAGSSNVICDNVIRGQLPRRIILAMVDNDAFNGDRAKDPYQFHHNNISYLAAYIDGVQYPQSPFKPNFSKGLVAREFEALYSACNQNIGHPTFEYSKAKFLANPIFAFNFAPDLSAGAGANGHLSLIRRGALRLQMDFSTALPHAVTLLVFCEYDNIIEIDETRVVQTDYN